MKLKKEFLMSIQESNLNEGQTFSRLRDYTYMGYVLMSVYKNESEEQDIERDKVFKTVLRKNNMGYQIVKGAYKYDGDSSVSYELSYIIPFNKNAYDTFTKQVIKIKDIIRNETYTRSDGETDDFNPECIVVASPFASKKQHSFTSGGTVELWYPSNNEHKFLGYSVGVDRKKNDNDEFEAYTEFTKGSHKGRVFNIRQVALEDTLIWNIYVKEKTEMRKREVKSHKFNDDALKHQSSHQKIK